MRFAFAIAVAIVLAACALEQSSSEHALLGGGWRAVQAEKDAAAIMQGMARAQWTSERVARDTNGNIVEPGAHTLTR